MSTQYIALLRAAYQAENEIEATLVAEEIRLNAEKELYTDEGDEAEVLQVVEFDADLANEQLVLQMRVVRNGLIKTKIRECWDMARELDHMAWLLERRAEPGFEPSGYDYSRFLEISHDVLDGQNPET